MSLINRHLQTHPTTVYVSFAAASAPSLGVGSLSAAISSEQGTLRKAQRLLRQAGGFMFSVCVRLGGGGHRKAACERAGFQPSEWLAHDGLLSVRGQRAPLGEESCELRSEYYAVRTPSSDDEAASRPRGKLREMQEADGAADDALESYVSDGAYDADTDCAPSTPSTADVCAAAIGRAVAVVSREPSSLREPSRVGLQRGVWHTHELDMDHFAVCGGPLASPHCIDSFWAMYCKRLRPSF